MNSKYAIAAALLLSVSAFAQKDELKALKKINDKQMQVTPVDIDEAKKLLGQLESKIGAATPEQQVDYHFYKGKTAAIEMMLNRNTAVVNFPIATENLNKVIELEKSGKKKYTKEIEEVIYPQVKNGAIAVAGDLAKEKKYKEAAMYYSAGYKVDPKDPSTLYNAAAMAVNGQDYANALAYYEELNKIGFTGEGTSYGAKNVKTGQMEYFPNKTLRDASVTAKQHSDPKDEVLPSLKGEIVKNIALIYIQQGQIEKAKTAMNDARKANPDDSSLIISEAQLYLETKDIETYKRLINEAIQKNPTNADLFYNLGVVTTPTDVNEALKHYAKALEIKPNYVNALVNVGVLSLRDEKKIVEEMNGLGNSKKDNDRYDVLKKQRDGLYKTALPYFEKAHAAEPDNQYVISLLANVYQALERMEDYKAMKAKIKAE